MQGKTAVSSLNNSRTEESPQLLAQQVKFVPSKSPYVITTETEKHYLELIISLHTEANKVVKLIEGKTIVIQKLENENRRLKSLKKRSN